MNSEDTMDFTPKYTMVFLHIKKAVILFLVLLFVTIPVARIIGLENIAGDSSMIHYVFSHYTVFSLLAIAAFFFYLASIVVILFIKSITNPQMHYQDTIGIKELDLPVIPNREKVYGFMNHVDKLYYKNSGRLSTQLLSRHRVDELGNKY